jgi:LPS sulfotransferase NodH
MAELVAKLRGAYRYATGTDLDVLEQVFGPVRFVHLQRGDVLAQAVSWARAEQTDHWQDGDSASERLPHFDSKEVDGYLRTINPHNAAWREWFSSFDIAPLGVTYEDLIADMSGTVAVIVRFLGLELPVDHIVEVRTRRQADEVNQEWVNRYRALGDGGS